MVTSVGLVKALNSGLARTAERLPPSATACAPASSPKFIALARRSRATPGVILGTAGYISPERTRGKAVDEYSDIFFFGGVLYEMLTGAGPFAGETVADSLGAIPHRDHGW